MTVIRLKHIKRMEDRHGKVRRYYNRPGYPKTPLPGLPGSKEFMDAYHAAAALKPVKVAPGASKIKHGSVAALLAEFYQSTDFKSNLKPQTQKNYRYLLESFRNTKIPGSEITCGDVMVKDFRPAHIARILDKLANTPGAARNLRKRLSKLFKFAIKREYRETNPIVDTEAPKPKSRDGFTPWSDAEIAKFYKHWQPGTKPHLAMTILYRTTVRRSDAVILGRQHIVATERGNELHFRSKKGDQWMEIPIDDVLQAEIDRLPADQMQFILTEYGKPFSEAGFTKWFRERAEMAGIYGRTPHGVRKAADREFAEAGSTPHEIGAVDGHRTLAEVERYTRSASRIDMAWSAVEKRQNKTAKGLKVAERKALESIEQAEGGLKAAKP